ncbi:transmembrane protein 170A [Condylostylus longicornis]|uniref:transmembrane protein 170A n=1 Tax=Condylostylus longicornis TaxID=2530218 RepID=UPI00244DEC7C|nr:transmembrane protein 170A [Condylostylus longicornis]XP_055379425.1 transmembrane protein 170A [Condylostylus longicornis]XP_055379427.1 transmembrane protein 170A [Condylostylus longicornis]
MSANSKFPEIWYSIFIWTVFSSIFIHTCAAIVSFLTLRKHKFGRFFSVLILVTGFVLPVTTGLISSAIIALVHWAATVPSHTDSDRFVYQFNEIYGIIYGVGQTILSACLGFTRILATL